MGPPPADGLPIGRGLSRRLWHAHAASAARALHHPFVRALADATLPRPTFRFYVQQDAAFLEAFGAAYDAARRAAERAGDGSAAATLARLRSAVADELKLHQTYAAGWGLSAADLAAPPAPATRAYTDFLAAAGDAAGPGDGLARVACILAAMAPCSRLYGWLGCTLDHARVVVGGAPPHPYADWVATYSSAEYLAAPAAKEELLDRLAADCGVDEGEWTAKRRVGDERWMGARLAQPRAARLICFLFVAANNKNAPARIQKRCGCRASLPGTSHKPPHACQRVPGIGRWLRRPRGGWLARPRRRPAAPHSRAATPSPVVRLHGF